MNQPLLIALRHGRSPQNQAGRFRGWDDGPDTCLNEEGRNDAREGATFAASLPVKYSFIVCDGLARTVETAQIARDIIGVSSQLVILKSALPWHVGKFTGTEKAAKPLGPYIQNPSKKIPGGESLNDFRSRNDTAIAAILQLPGVPLYVVHTSTLTYLENLALRISGKDAQEDNRDTEEDVPLMPGGVALFNSNGVFPLFKKGEGTAPPLKDGTAVSGFVTVEENQPPRECWNCRHYSHDSCIHPVVRMDPELQSRRKADGSIAVGDKECCDSFQNKKS